MNPPVAMCSEKQVSSTPCAHSGPYWHWSAGRAWCLVEPLGWDFSICTPQGYACDPILSFHLCKNGLCYPAHRFEREDNEAQPGDAGGSQDGEYRKRPDCRYLGVQGSKDVGRARRGRPGASLCRGQDWAGRWAAPSWGSGHSICPMNVSQ